MVSRTWSVRLKTSIGSSAAAVGVARRCGSARRTRSATSTAAAPARAGPASGNVGVTGKYGSAEQPGERLDVADHRVDLLGADDRARDDRRAACAAPPRRSRRGRSAAACSGRVNGLPMPLKPSGHTPTSSPERQQPLGVRVAGQRVPGLAGQRRRRPASRNTRSAPSIRRCAVRRVVVVHGDLRSSARRAATVPEWLATTSAPPSAGTFSSAVDLHAEPLLVQRAERRQQHVVGELRVEPEARRPRSRR